MTRAVQHDAKSFSAATIPGLLSSEEAEIKGVSGLLSVGVQLRYSLLQHL